MNTNTTTNELTPATLTSNRPRIKTSVRPPAREAMPWYTCASLVL